MYRDMTRGSITRGLLLFALLIIRGYWLALNARDRFGSLVIVGITTLFAFQADAVGYGYYFLRRRALLPGERDV